MKFILIGIVLISGCRLFGSDDPTPDVTDTPDADASVADQGSDATPDVARDLGGDTGRDIALDRSIDVAIDYGSDAPDLPRCALDDFSPIAHWSLDLVENGTYENRGSDATISPAFAIGAPETVSTLSARGNALRFDGVDDGLVIPHSTALELVEGTVSIWVNAADYTGSDDLRGIFTKDHTNSGTGGHFGLFASATGSASYRYQTILDGVDLQSGVLPVDQWVHLVATFAPNGMAFYVNSVPTAVNLIFTGSWFDPTQNVANTEPIGIGFSTAYSDPGGYTPLDGFLGLAVDEVMIFDRTLTGPEVAALRTAVLTECLPF